MPFAYYDRLSPASKATYRRSDRLQAVPMPRPDALPPLARAIADALAADDPRRVERACQALVDEISAQLRVPPLRVHVREERPSDDLGELHGLYTPDNLKPVATIEVWMRTAKQHRVVAPRTFLRTVVHELCHHLDYELFELPETFHTQGFYQRESSLMNQLRLPARPRAAPADASAPDAPVRKPRAAPAERRAESRAIRRRTPS